MAEVESLENLLLLEMSRRNTDMVVGLAGQKQELFDELFMLFLRNEEPVSRRAAWAIDILTEKKAGLLVPYIDIIVDALPQFSHDGMKRHSLRMLTRSPLPSEEHLGKLISLCFIWLISPKEAIAVKVYCMELLYRFSIAEPELKKELADSLEWRMDEETPGFRSRGQKLLKILYKEIADNRCAG
jgi:hypothetical protein